MTLVSFLAQYLLSTYTDHNKMNSTENSLVLPKIDLKTDFSAITIVFFKIIWYWSLTSAFIHNGKKFKNSRTETILGLTIDNKLFIAT